MAILPTYLFRISVAYVKVPGRLASSVRDGLAYWTTIHKRAALHQMHLTDIDLLLQRIYWIAQIALAAIAVCAAIAAFIQIRTFKLFELLKYIKEPYIVDARRIVIREIEPKRKDNWWDEGADANRLEKEASTVCGSYDLIGRMAKFDRLERFLPGSGFSRFFALYWSDSIIRTYEALEPFILARRLENRDAYAGYTWLYQSARKHDRISGNHPRNSN